MKSAFWGLVHSISLSWPQIQAWEDYGNDAVLVDEHGKAANQGLLAAWDRTLTEVTDKLWLAVDFQSGRNVLGSVNFGLAWAFSTNVSVILGYDLYLDSAIAGRDTLTFQVDINI